MNKPSSSSISRVTADEDDVCRTTSTTTRGRLSLPLVRSGFFAINLGPSKGKALLPLKATPLNANELQRTSVAAARPWGMLVASLPAAWMLPRLGRVSGSRLTGYIAHIRGSYFVYYFTSSILLITHLYFFEIRLDFGG